MLSLFHRSSKARKLGLIRDTKRYLITPEESIKMRVNAKPYLVKDPELEEDKFDGKPGPHDFDAFLDQDPPAKVGKEILKLGKLYYKHIHRVPDWIMTKLSEITENRSAGQVRKKLQSWMIVNDRDDLTVYKNRQLGWSSVMPKDIPKVITYGPEETVVYGKYFFTSRYAILVRILDELKITKPNFIPRRVLDYGCGPGTGFTAVRQVWDNLKRNPYYNTDKDNEMYHNNKKQPSIMMKYTGIDISQSMIDAARIMSDNQGVNCIFYDKIAPIVQDVKQKLYRYDLIICSYTLNELVLDASRKAAVQILFELLDEDGLIVFVENGNPYGSHTVRTARQFILNFFNNQIDSTNVDQISDTTIEDIEEIKKKFKEYKDKNKSYMIDEDVLFEESQQKLKVESAEDIQEEMVGEDGDNKDKFMSGRQYKRQKQKDKNKTDKSITAPRKIRFILDPPSGRSSNAELKARVVSPCTHDKPCPLGEGVWCSFAQKVHSGMIRQGSSEKFSYVIMQKTARPGFERQFTTSQIQQLLHIEEKMVTNTTQNIHPLLQSHINTLVQYGQIDTSDSNSTLKKMNENKVDLFKLGRKFHATTFDMTPNISIGSRTELDKSIYDYHEKDMNKEKKVYKKGDMKDLPYNINKKIKASYVPETVTYPPSQRDKDGDNTTTTTTTTDDDNNNNNKNTIKDTTTSKWNKTSTTSLQDPVTVSNETVLFQLPDLWLIDDLHQVTQSPSSSTKTTNSSTNNNHNKDKNMNADTEDDVSFLSQLEEDYDPSPLAILRQFMKLKAQKGEDDSIYDNLHKNDEGSSSNNSSGSSSNAKYSPNDEEEDEENTEDIDFEDDDFDADDEEQEESKNGPNHHHQVSIEGVDGKDMKLDDLLRKYDDEFNKNDDDDENDEDKVMNSNEDYRFYNTYGYDRKSPRGRKLEQLIYALQEHVAWDAYKPSLFRHEWTRVIRTPLKARGHIILDVCHPEGVVVRHTISRSDTEAVPQMYSALRKITWGGLFPAIQKVDNTIKNKKLKPAAQLLSDTSEYSNYDEYIKDDHMSEKRNKKKEDKKNKMKNSEYNDANSQDASFTHMKSESMKKYANKNISISQQQGEEEEDDLEEYLQRADGRSRKINVKRLKNEKNETTVTNITTVSDTKYSHTKQPLEKHDSFESVEEDMSYGSTRASRVSTIDRRSPSYRRAINKSKISVNGDASVTSDSNLSSRSSSTTTDINKLSVDLNRINPKYDVDTFQQSPGERIDMDSAGRVTRTRLSAEGTTEKDEFYMKSSQEDALTLEYMSSVLSGKMTKKEALKQLKQKISTITTDGNTDKRAQLMKTEKYDLDNEDDDDEDDNDITISKSSTTTSSTTNNKNNSNSRKRSTCSNDNMSKKQVYQDTEDYVEYEDLKDIRKRLQKEKSMKNKEMKSIKNNSSSSSSSKNNTVKVSDAELNSLNIVEDHKWTPKSKKDTVTSPTPQKSSSTLDAFTSIATSARSAQKLLNKDYEEKEDENNDVDMSDMDFNTKEFQKFEEYLKNMNETIPPVQSRREKGPKKLKRVLTSNKSNNSADDDSTDFIHNDNESVKKSSSNMTESYPMAATTRYGSISNDDYSYSTTIKTNNATISSPKDVSPVNTKSNDNVKPSVNVVALKNALLQRAKQLNQMKDTNSNNNNTSNHELKPSPSSRNNVTKYTMKNEYPQVAQRYTIEDAQKNNDINMNTTNQKEFFNFNNDFSDINEDDDDEIGMNIKSTGGRRTTRSTTKIIRRKK